MYERFNLTLMVTRACNLRCSYCYNGRKSAERMPEPLAIRAIERALASLAPAGTLELAFFGGEPLLESGMIGRLIEHAHTGAAASDINVVISITTNGTIVDPRAWSLMTHPDVELAVSHDGLPEVHDRCRHRADGSGTSNEVLSVIGRLVEANRSFRVVTVVRPETVESLVDGIRFLQSLGVRYVDPTLDLWTLWTDAAIERLERAIARCARLWGEGLPVRGIGWFDEKAAELMQVPTTPTARCGFGDGQIAVAPSGRLYPCERLIGEDGPDNAMALPGHALDGVAFQPHRFAAAPSTDECRECTMYAMCNSFCRCSNYVRSGDVSRPDLLLCRWNEACLTETAAVLNAMSATSAEQ